MARSQIGDSGLELILDILRRRKWAGLMTFAAIFSLAAPFSIFLPDIYRGSATVIVESQDASSDFVKASVPELETRLVTIQQEILSRSRLSDLINRLNLYPRMRGQVPTDALVERMRRDIHVEFTGTDQNRGRPTTIGLKISYIGLDPKSAAEVPNALVAASFPSGEYSSRVNWPPQRRSSSVRTAGSRPSRSNARASCLTRSPSTW